MRSLLFSLLVLPLTLYAAQDAPCDPFDHMVKCYDERGGDKYMIQEEIIQRSHVLQAAYLASLAGAPEVAIVGLLYHDIGQVLDADVAGNAMQLHYDHDDRGADWMREQGFPEHICMWVQSHTLAKLVLCMEDPDYFEQLSEASKISYAVQSSKYFGEGYAGSLDRFLESPYAQDYRAMRRCDDMSKIAGMNSDEERAGVSLRRRISLPGFEHYRQMVYRVLLGEGRPAANPHWHEKVKLMHDCMRLNRWTFEEKVKSERDPDFQELRRRITAPLRECQ